MLTSQTSTYLIVTVSKIFAGLIVLFVFNLIFRVVVIITKRIAKPRPRYIYIYIYAFDQIHNIYERVTNVSVYLLYLQCHLSYHYTQICIHAFFSFRERALMRSMIMEYAGSTDIKISNSIQSFKHLYLRHFMMC